MMHRRTKTWVSRYEWHSANALKAQQRNNNPLLTCIVLTPELRYAVCGLGSRVDTIRLYYPKSHWAHLFLASVETLSYSVPVSSCFGANIPAKS